MKLGVPGKVLQFLLIGIVVAAVGTGLWLLGPISEQRSKKLDEKRISDLQFINGALQSYWNINKKLPSDLKKLENLPGVLISTNDPKTRQPYVYRVKGTANYELCSEFETESTGTLSRWSHGKGQECFEFEIKEESR